MKVSEKYTTIEKIEEITDSKEKEEEQKKTILSNDAFSICDFIGLLIKKIEHTRTSLIK